MLFVSINDALRNHFNAKGLRLRGTLWDSRIDSTDTRLFPCFLSLLQGYSGSRFGIPGSIVSRNSYYSKLGQREAKYGVKTIMLLPLVNRLTFCWIGSITIIHPPQLNRIRFSSFIISGLRQNIWVMLCLIPNSSLWPELSDTVTPQ